ncbi:MAG TPA: hypothetical protein VND93_08565 [Myxococcales bacterium]|nr:hypothetical protein [Myxococcales bacterium]
MGSTKTTFLLSDTVRERLKTTAARQRKSVKQLLTEGAELVLARYQDVADRVELQRRASLARERLRAGLYGGPPVAGEVDRLLYDRQDDRRTPRAHRRRRA